MRKHLALALVTLVALALASVAAAATPKLNGTVGPGYTITLKKAGTKVTKLKAGKYTFVINDRASIHNYNLDGPHGFGITKSSLPAWSSRNRARRSVMCAGYSGMVRLSRSRG